MSAATGQSNSTAGVRFTANRYETKIICLIARRAERLARRAGILRPVIDWSMDIEAAHCNGNPLRLQELLDADDFNFTHDVMGIMTHINRDTGALENCFSPRYSAPSVLSPEKRIVGTRNPVDVTP